MTANSPAVLIVEDDPAIQRLLRNTLKVQDYRVIEAGTGAAALRLVQSSQPDLIILDLGLPDVDGMSVIRDVREGSTVPIVVLTSRDDERSKVTALDMGADDYVTKPFGVDELMARVRTALRHRLAALGSRPIFRTGALEVDLVRRLVTLAGDEVRLSRKEYEILQQLVIHAGKVLTHRHLLREAWGNGEDIDVQYLRVYVRQIRQKIEKDPGRPQYVLTEPGVGYRLQVLEED
ncbi:MAG: response regulator [Rhodospirillaceae bacterium]|nr:response regulator [Rhodospirillaceae bacterium]